MPSFKSGEYGVKSERDKGGFTKLSDVTLLPSLRPTIPEKGSLTKSQEPLATESVVFVQTQFGRTWSEHFTIVPISHVIYKQSN